MDSGAVKREPDIGEAVSPAKRRRKGGEEKRRKGRRALKEEHEVESSAPEPAAEDLERSMRRVTFADEDSEPGSLADSQRDVLDELELPSPTPMDTDEPPNSQVAPAMWSKSIKSREVRVMEFRIDSPVARCLDVVAHRTMGPYVLERDRCLTRRIVVNGDMGADRLYAGVDAFRTRSNKRLLPWPSTDLQRYLNRAPADILHPMGIGVLENPCTTHVALEEPGAEWETHELDVGAEDLEDRAGEGAQGPPSDEIDISDPLANGGIGLVIRRRRDSEESPTANSGEAVEFLTKNQLLYPGLQEPRYSRVPLPDEFTDPSRTPVLAPCLGPLVDMTRVQVLNQILRQKSPWAMPLSKFVSCTVAEEAVAGMARTWAAVNECLRISQRRGREPIVAGMAGTQWIAVLNAALSAGLPPEAVARAYYRLEKLCDVIAGGKLVTTSMVLISCNHSLDYRRLARGTGAVED
ncbi:hypothetical protein LPJ61_001784 [Coemansia biformis]|uniref:Uncharacterized protein n=1 Tax=Coemansia biformis TaxID=1286918 RepID=A0A9W8CZ91_9FUNG|nr:hypothetical protein LPJ61_001784 [Coemansia biformis]